jgi:hypothetical protein
MSTSCNSGLISAVPDGVAQHAFSSSVWAAHATNKRQGIYSTANSPVRPLCSHAGSCNEFFFFKKYTAPSKLVLAAAIRDIFISKIFPHIFLISSLHSASQTWLPNCTVSCNNLICYKSLLSPSLYGGTYGGKIVCRKPFVRNFNRWFIHSL